MTMCLVGYYKETNMKIISSIEPRKNVNILVIRLNNGNTIEISEISDDSIEFRNTTHIPDPDSYLGLSITPIDFSTVEITPEG